MGVLAMTTSSVLPDPSARSDPDEPLPEPEPAEPQADPAVDAARQRWIRNGVDVAVVALCVVFIVGPLHPDLLLTNSTPAGGDMGAHVWAPAFLRDELLPSLRLSGWTPDWYAGFPAFQFYMVVPSLMIVAVNSGVQGWLAIVPFIVSLAIGLPSILRLEGRRRIVGVTIALLVAVLGIGVPYGVAFKWVTVSGVLTLPLAAYVFGRLIRFRSPGPAVLAVATVPFLFDRGFTIYGGNIPSTLAGEFAFSISLSIALLYLGFLARGLETGQYRATSAVLLALTGLCHLIPAFFALAGTAVLLLMRMASTRSARSIGRSVGWAAVVGLVGGLLSAFWVLPFFWQRTFLNDMGWEKLAVRGADQAIWTWLREDIQPHLLPESITWAVFLAVIGIVLSIVFKIRIGVFLTVMAAVIAVGFVFLPEGRLWNARILPFYYLCIYMLAAVGVTEVGRSLALIASPEPVEGGPDQQPHRWLEWVTAPMSFAAVAVVVGLPLAALPLGSTAEDGTYRWLGLSTADDSFVPGWAEWNYRGYEGKDAYPEYHGIVTEMDRVGDSNGCGRSMWEYQKELDRYGTPMALMLLPFWTEGCIGSMEGLYFEASSTTPFHFLLQSELSAAPSNAQRDLPYRQFDIDAGVDHLQLFGVRYYLATSTQAITAASTHPDLTEVGSSGPWVVYEVADAPLVEGVDAVPAVTTSSNAQDEWLCDGLDVKTESGLRGTNPTCSGPALDWFQSDPDEQVFVASDGPDEWERVDYPTPPVRTPIEPAVVTDVVADTNSISFEVDRVGAPVLVKASYFPNWEVSGGDGPYRVAPNLMLVVPTDTNVELTFGREAIDWIAWLLTLVGIGMVIALVRRGDRWLTLGS
ncbi:MAG TPA: 6-pyruvoyl-tetrahydropterin synthase-related protein [Acidimicrobiales bacterium]|nr:6-pyruvoyl-tetrahydropterin synthase-related protein [Acidimicrobiales bacterium]